MKQQIETIHKDLIPLLKAQGIRLAEDISIQDAKELPIDEKNDSYAIKALKASWNIKTIVTGICHFTLWISTYTKGYEQLKKTAKNFDRKERKADGMWPQVIDDTTLALVKLYQSWMQAYLPQVDQGVFFGFSGEATIVPKLFSFLGKDIKKVQEEFHENALWIDFSIYKYEWLKEGKKYNWLEGNEHLSPDELKWYYKNIDKDDVIVIDKKAFLEKLKRLIPNIVKGFVEENKNKKLARKVANEFYFEVGAIEYKKEIAEINQQFIHLKTLFGEGNGNEYKQKLIEVEKNIKQLFLYHQQSYNLENSAIEDHFKGTRLNFICYEMAYEIFHGFRKATPKEISQKITELLKKKADDYKIEFSTLENYFEQVYLIHFIYSAIWDEFVSSLHEGSSNIDNLAKKHAKKYGVKYKFEFDEGYFYETRKQLAIHFLEQEIVKDRTDFEERLETLRDLYKTTYSTYKKQIEGFKQNPAISKEQLVECEEQAAVDFRRCQTENGPIEEKINGLRAALKKLGEVHKFSSAKLLRIFDEEFLGPHDKIMQNEVLMFEFKIRTELQGLKAKITSNQKDAVSNLDADNLSNPPSEQYDTDSEEGYSSASSSKEMNGEREFSDSEANDSGHDSGSESQRNGSSYVGNACATNNDEKVQLNTVLDPDSIATPGNAQQPQNDTFAAALAQINKLGEKIGRCEGLIKTFKAKKITGEKYASLERGIASLKDKHDKHKETIVSKLHELFSIINEKITELQTAIAIGLNDAADFKEAFKKGPKGYGDIEIDYRNIEADIQNANNLLEQIPINGNEELVDPFIKLQKKYGNLFENIPHSLIVKNQMIVEGEIQKLETYFSFYSINDLFAKSIEISEILDIADEILVGAVSTENGENVAVLQNKQEQFKARLQAIQLRARMEEFKARFEKIENGYNRFQEGYRISGATKSLIEKACEMKKLNKQIEEVISELNQLGDFEKFCTDNAIKYTGSSDDNAIEKMASSIYRKHLIPFEEKELKKEIGAIQRKFANEIKSTQANFIKEFVGLESEVKSIFSHNAQMKMAHAEKLNILDAKRRGLFVDFFGDSKTPGKLTQSRKERYLSERHKTYRVYDAFDSFFVKCAGGQTDAKRREEYLENVLKPELQDFAASNNGEFPESLLQTINRGIAQFKPRGNNRENPDERSLCFLLLELKKQVLAICPDQRDLHEQQKAIDAIDADQVLFQAQALR